jgi:predicted site-specific integrase-resolvase
MVDEMYGSAGWVAERLGVSSRTINRWQKQGKFRGRVQVQRSVGGWNMYNRAQVEALAAELIRHPDLMER